MDRRTFLKGSAGGVAGILAAKYAPAAIGSDVLMPVRQIVTPKSAGPVYIVTGFTRNEFGDVVNFKAVQAINRFAVSTFDLSGEWNGMTIGDTVRINV